MSRSPPALSRRTLLGGIGASVIAAPALLSCTSARAPRWAAGDPFSLGVACGDPTPDGFVLWTRLAPLPLHTDPAMPGGMSGGAVEIDYEIAGDVAMRNVVRRDRKSTRLNSSHQIISYAVFCLEQ